MSLRPDEMFAAGVVTGTHGLRGDLKVRAASGPASGLLAAQRVWLRPPRGEAAPFAVERAVFHKGSVLLRLQGVEAIEQAELLVGAEVRMPLADLPELLEDEYYWFELEGMAVVDRKRGEIGSLVDLIETGAHDVYVVRGRFGEILIPAVESFVVAIDLPSRRMEVDLPEGLVPESDDL